jgi:NADH:ubiquinone oxidoreductase subunit 6 (subunit J)
LAGLIAWVVLGNRYTVAARPGGDMSLPSLADMLLTTYAVPFELASVLLLTVLIGAIIVARKKYLHDRD